MNRYLHYQYKPGARGEDGLIDCWGLTKLARTEIYGKDDLPDFPGARYAKKGSVQAAYTEQSARMVICDKKPGAVIAVMRCDVCVHVALMLSGNRVLEIKREGQKARITPWREFAKQYPAPMWSIEFYD